MQDLFRFSRWRAPLLVLFVVVAGLLMTSASVMAAPPLDEPVMFTHGGGQPQSDCPTGMIVVAKFNRGSGISNSYSEIVNTAGVDLDDENRYGGDWSSTTPIAHVRVTGTYGGSNTTNHDPAVTSGSFNNSGLVDGPGSGNRRYVEDVIFCAEEIGTVTVLKFNDLNENGVQDNGELPLSGWEFTLYQDNQQVGDSDTTDANGLVSFEAPVGDYVICETLQNGWTNSTPLCQPATVSAAPPPPPTPITQTDLITYYNDGFRVEFLGVSNNGLTWSYRVSELIRPNSQNRDLSHWVIGVCGSLTPNNVTASSPTYSDFNTDPTTQVFGIKWDVADNYDGQGGDGGDSAVFSFTLDTVYQITNVPVAVKSGGPGSDQSRKIDVEEIAGPSCDEPADPPEPIAFGNYEATGSVKVFKQVGTNGNFFDESTDGIFDFVYASASEQTGFQLSDTAQGGAPQSFFRDDLPTGAYSISETSQPDSNWQFFDAYCSLSDNPLDYLLQQSWIDFDLTDSNISFDLEPGQNVFCFFLNNYTPPPPTGSITIIKNVVGDDFSDILFDFTFDGSTNFQLSENSEPYVIEDLVADTYNITESFPEDWDLTSINCGVNQNNFAAVDGVNVVLEAGENVTCTFNNTPPTTGALTITKDAQPDSDQVFEFTGSIGTLDLVDDGIDNGLFNSQQYEIDAGNQVVFETPIDGWELTDVTCTGTDTYSADLETGQLNVTIPAGGNVNCTFTNVQEPPNEDLCEMNPDSILVNGCFEEPVVSGGNWNIYDNVPGWDIEWLDGNPCPVTNIDPSLELQTEATLGNVDVINGDQYAELDTDCEGPHGDSNPERTTVEISQTLTTIPGHRYEVSFYFNARPNHTNQNLRVTIDGNELFSEAPPSDWEERTFEFVATSTETVIAFADTGYANSYGVLLDCINVVDLGAEPTGDIWAFKYNDQNGNGSWFYEPALGGWEFMVYDSEGTQVGSSQNTNGAGFAYFNDLPVGTYTVCEVQQEGWTNTQPGTINETYGQPCVETEVEAEDLDILSFGNHEVETGNLRVIKQLDRGVFSPDTSDISFEVCVVDSGNNEVGCADLSQSNNWRYTWHDLTVGDYTVVETTDNLPEGWSPVISEVETTVEADTLSIARVRNVYVAPERPQAETCISLADLNYSEGTVIENQWLGNGSNPQLVRVLTSTGNAQIVQFGGSIFGWVSNGTSDNFSGADPFAIMDMGHEHAYTFRFPNDIVVTGFSIRVYDWSDYNPANAREWSVELSAQGNSDTDGLSFSGVNTTGGAGDSYQALIGQPGNRRYAIVADSGNSFNRVYLNFDHDGNRPYTPSRHGQIDNPNSADPYLGLDELCITYEDLGGIRVTKFNDLNENGTRQNGEDRLPGWTFNVYEGNEAVGDPIRTGVTNSNGRRTFGNLLPGTYTVCEVMEAGWTNVTPLCQTVEVVSGQRAELGFGNIELPPVTETCNASEVVAFNQGLDRNYNPIVALRSNPDQALGEPQDADNYNFVSLGFGGELILRLDGLVVDNNGSDFDLYFVETTFGNETPASYPESAEIFIALNPAGPWTSLGTVTLDGGFDFPGDGASALYVRLVDTSNRGSFSSGVADGYDLDGIRCNEPDGEIVVTKRVDWNGAEVDHQQGFTLCISGDNLEEPLCGTVDYDGGTVYFDVEPGLYSVYEYDPGDEWTVSGQTSVQVASGQTRRVTITNTHDEPEPVDGRIVVTKNVVDAPQGFDGTFTICVSGGDLAQPSCQNVGANGGELSWVLPAGSYNINENYPGENWLVEGNDHAVELEAGATETHTITNRYEEPEPEEQVGTIRVTKNVVTPPAQHGDFTICINGAVFPEDQQNQPNCYNVHNNGDQIWWNVVIPVGEQSASYVISENNPGANWSVDGSGVSVTVYPNQTSYHTITNTYNTPPPPSCDGGMGQQSDLSGFITISGSTAFGTVYNNSNVEDCQYQIGMASYSKYDEIIDNQVLFAGFDTVVTIPAGGSVQISIALPECSAQVDLFYGSFLPDLNGQRYGSRLLAAVHNNIGYCQAPVVNPPQEQPPQEIIIEEQQPPQEGGAGE